MKCTSSYNNHDCIHKEDNIICASLADPEGKKVNTIDTQLIFKRWELGSSKIEDEKNLINKYMKY